MVKLEEYKGITIEDIMELTGLPNRFPDQSKYSLARQKELLLKDAQKNNVLHLVEKTNPIKHKTLNINMDKDLVITKLKESDKINYTSNLDLNLIPHKVIREKGLTTIIVNQSDIPLNVIKNPKAGYVYNVIGIFESHKAYYDSTTFKDENGKAIKVASKYIFGYTKDISLLIVE